MDEVHGNSIACSFNHSRLKAMNEFKTVWYQNTLVSDDSSPQVQQRITRKNGRSFRHKAVHGGRDFAITRGQRKIKSTVMVRGATIGAGVTATGALGTGVRVGGRIGLRFIPILGWALLAYDLYTLGSYLMED